MTPRADGVGAVRALGPVHEYLLMGRSIMLFDGITPDRLAALGETRMPGIADLFVVYMQHRQGTQPHLPRGVGMSAVMEPGASVRGPGVWSGFGWSVRREVWEHRR